ncbi:MAG: glutamine synthetase family protein [Candidatus Acidifodinimicrobium sp.]
MTKNWTHLLFTDLRGVTRSVSYLIDCSDSKFRGKTDGSSSYGFGHIEDSDLELVPDHHMPVNDLGGAKILFSYVYKNNRPLEQDPRRISKSMEETLENNGYKSLVAGELEFFVVDSVSASVRKVNGKFEHRVEINSTEFLENGDYQNKASYMLPLKGKSKDLSYILMGLSDYIDLEVMHHEVASSQYELNVKPKSVKDAADNIIFSKYFLREKLADLGKIPIFLPKPFPYDNGSGLHTNVSLWRGSENLFYDKDDSYANLSQFGRYFIGGLLEHGKSLSAVVSPTVNSYRRLVPGFEAPIYLVWGRSNRSAALRVPFSSDSSKKRIEYRPPDPSSNPYLSFVGVLAAGLDGLTKKIDPGNPEDRDVYELDLKSKSKIPSIPGSLSEALDALESDNEYLVQFFGRSTLDAYIDLKRQELKNAAPVASAVEILDAIGI